MPEPTRCPDCGAPLVPGDRYCAECGASVVADAPAAPSAATPTLASAPAAASSAPGWPSGSAAGQGWSAPLAPPAPDHAAPAPVTAPAPAAADAPPRSDAGWFATTRPSTMFATAVMALLAALLLGAVGQVDPTDTLVLVAEFVGLFGLALLAAAIARAIAGLVTRR